MILLIIFGILDIIGILFFIILSICEKDEMKDSW